MKLTVGQCATLACMLEVAAPKVGNVHRGADFDDLTLEDFLVAAVAIGPIMDQAASKGVGWTVLAAAEATKAMVHSNVNLGILLLLAPLAAVPDNETLETGLGNILEKLDGADGEDVYAAIRLMNPGGLGDVDEMDIHSSDSAEPIGLQEAMGLAADRDLIARQYVNGFQQVFEDALAAILAARSTGLTLSSAIVHAHVQFMSRYPDSLIARKCGQPMADQAAELALAVVQSGPPQSEAYLSRLGDLDFWLRSDHHRRNPGTSADVIAAALFAGLRSGSIAPPFGGGELDS